MFISLARAEAESHMKPCYPDRAFSLGRGPPPKLDIPRVSFTRQRKYLQSPPGSCQVCRAGSFFTSSLSGIYRHLGGSPLWKGGFAQPEGERELIRAISSLLWGIYSLTTTCEEVALSSWSELRVLALGCISDFSWDLSPIHGFHCT